MCAEMIDLVIREGLLDAANYIERNGWRRAVPHPMGGPACIARAIAMHLPAPRWHDGLRAFGNHVGCGLDVAGWNDTKCRGPEHAIEALRGAASAP